MEITCIVDGWLLLLLACLLLGKVSYSDTDSFLGPQMRTFIIV